MIFNKFETFIGGEPGGKMLDTPLGAECSSGSQLRYYEIKLLLNSQSLYVDQQNKEKIPKYKIKIMIT